MNPIINRPEKDLYVSNCERVEVNNLFMLDDKKLNYLFEQMKLQKKEIMQLQLQNIEREKSLKNLKKECDGLKKTIEKIKKQKQIIGITSALPREDK